MRRRTLLTAAAAAVLLPACGRDDDPSALGSPASRTVKHAAGRSTIPVDPRRVVSMDETQALNMAALSVPLVGAVEPNIASRTAYFEALDQVRSMGSTLDPDLEKVVAARPDLIVTRAEGGQVANDNYERLSSIAPTIAVDFVNSEWQRMLADLARMIGREDRARELLDDFETRRDEVREVVTAAGGPTVNYLRVRADGSLDVYVGNFPSVLLRDAGMRRTARLPFRPDAEYTEQDDHDVELSPERIDQADADVLFVGADPGTEQVLEDLDTNPLWRRLGAVRGGHVHQVDSTVWLAPGYLNAKTVMGDIERAVERLT